MKKFLTVTAVVLTAVILLVAKAGSDTNSYNMRRATEEFNAGRSAAAIDFLSEEIKDNPKNGNAYLTRATIEYDNEDYEAAFSDVTKALELLPKKDKKNRAAALLLRGNLYLDMGDFYKAIPDYNLAIKTDPANEEVYAARGELFYNFDQLDSSEADYRKITELNPANGLGYLGLGCVAKKRGDYRYAITNLNKAISLTPGFALPHSNRADCHLKLENYVEAAEDIIQALDFDLDEQAFQMILSFPEPQLPVLIAKLKAQSVKQPYDSRWPLLIGEAYAAKHRYPEAIEVFEKGLEVDEHPLFFSRISDCYQEMGDYDRAIDYIDRAIAINPGDMTHESQKAIALELSGDFDSALALWDEIIEQEPDHPYPYYRKGFIKHNLRQEDEALADLDMSLMLDPDYIHALLTKGDILKLKGDTAAAHDAYRKVVEIDTVPTSNSCAMFAFVELGEEEMGIDFLEKCIEAAPLESGTYYDGACIYSRMGRLDEAMEYLLKAVDKGFSKFIHITTDDDMDALRATPAFQEFYEANKERFEPAKLTKRTKTGGEDDELEAEEEENTLIDGAVEVPFTPYGGCASVKCSINDLPLTFIFDTGASTVSISQLEANFMLKNGYLTSDDFVGSGRFVDANGNVTEGSLVNLREVEFGGMKLSNVKASVVRNQKAPLLLGQSVLGRLGSIHIDNTRRLLLIYP